MIEEVLWKLVSWYKKKDKELKPFHQPNTLQINFVTNTLILLAFYIYFVVDIIEVGRRRTEDDTLLWRGGTWSHQERKKQHNHNCSLVWPLWFALPKHFSFSSSSTFTIGVSWSIAQKHVTDLVTSGLHFHWQLLHAWLSIPTEDANSLWVANIFCIQWHSRRSGFSFW